MTERPSDASACANPAVRPVFGLHLLREDLGDDDSFTPEIVSGYQFTLPLGMDSAPPAATQPASVPAVAHFPNLPSRSNPRNTSPSPLRRINAATDTRPPPLPPLPPLSPLPSFSALPPLPPPDDLDPDDENDDDYDDSDAYEPEDDIPYETSHYNQNDYSNDVMDFPDQDPQGDAAKDHDHRTDAIYDDLDDIGDWVANTAPTPGTDLIKRFIRFNNTITPSVTVAASNNSPAQKSAAMLATAALHAHQRLDDRRRDNLSRDKLNHSTVEQVLDPRTRMILFRLLSRNRLRTLDGCVSTGKEANVYYATAAALPNSHPDPNGIYSPNHGLLAHDSAPDAPVAVKVFKTSILQFKDRERYVAGEFRFRRTGYQRGSNRKMVQQWAEKEFRNQMRLHEAGIPAPVPLLLKPPVLIMSFFGKDGWPAPRLKDASLSPARLARAYFKVCILMRRMFRVAHLVHGDLSEYNMLYWNGDIVIIDVSQSVEDDHPMALDFLRRDCANVNDFFRRSGVVAVLGVRELFDFVSGEDVGDTKEKQESALTFLLEAAGSRTPKALNVMQQDDEVFMQSYIPRTLQEVELNESDLRGKNGDVDSNLFARLTGLSLTQKRNRRGSGSKDTSVEGAGSIGAPDAFAPRGDETYADDVELDSSANGASILNLDVECVEPTTSRLPVLKEHHQLGSSSPCTSNSSSRIQGEDLRDSRNLSVVEPVKAGSGEDGTWEVTKGVEVRFEDEYGQNVGPSLSHSTANKIGKESSVRADSQLDDDTFDATADSTSESEDWDAEQNNESSDPFAGMTKKEWKKKVKAEKREQRLHKVPKHVKKRKETLARRRRGTK